MTKSLAHREVLIPSKNASVAEQAEAFMFNFFPNAREADTIHYFAPGLYIREMVAKANTLAIGMEHLTEHLFVLSEGTLQVSDGVNVVEMSAPFAVMAGKGRKLAYTLTDCSILNVHETSETDIDRLESMLYKKTDTQLRHEALEKEKWLDSYQQQS